MNGNLEKANDYLKKLYARLNEKADLNDDDELLKEANEICKRLNQINRTSKLRVLLRIVLVVLLVIGLAILFWDEVYIHLIYLLRWAVIFVNPIIDLTVFYNDKCLVKNPFYSVPSRFTIDTCKRTCSDFDRLMFDRYDTTNFTREAFHKYLTKNDVALIETSEINSTWNANITIHSLANLYLDKRSQMYEQYFCMFSTKNIKAKSIFKFLDDVNENKVENFSTRWENCDLITSKVLRKIYRRPSFLPLNIELVSQSWILLSNEEQRSYTNLPASLRYVLFSQIKGETMIKLTPVEECISKCTNKRVHVKAGEILVYTDMWNMEYKSTSKDENIAIILLAH